MLLVGVVLSLLFIVYCFYRSYKDYGPASWFHPFYTKSHVSEQPATGHERRGETNESTMVVDGQVMRIIEVPADEGP